MKLSTVEKYRNDKSSTVPGTVAMANSIDPAHRIRQFPPHTDVHHGGYFQQISIGARLVPRLILVSLRVDLTTTAPLYQENQSLSQ